MVNGVPRVHGTEARGAIPATYRALTVIWVVIALAGWLVYPQVANAGTRTYEVVSARPMAKVATSVWPPFSNGTARHVERLETVDGRWALETSGLEDEKAEGAVYGKMRDSTGRVVWEGTISDVNYLSIARPAFLTTSSLGTHTRLYNLEVGTAPLLTFPSGMDDIVWAPDGSAFAVSGAGQVRIATITGKILGSFALQDRGRDNICSAVSDSGRYFAVGEGKMEPEPLPEGSVPADTYPRVDVTKRNAPGDTTRRVRSGLPPPSRRAMRVTYRGVTIYDRNGHPVGQVNMSRPWDFPRCLAITDESPPRIAVATDVGISVWSANRHTIWQDSMVFGLVGPPRVCAISIGNEGHVFAVTQSSSGPLAFWAWDTSDGLEGQVPLPENGRPEAIEVQFGSVAGDTAEIRTQSSVYVIKWRVGAK